MTRALGIERRRRCVQDHVIVCGVPRNRNRPSLTATIDPDLNARLRTLVERLPSATLSKTLDQLLEMGLPVFEDMADAYEAARGDDGTIDDRRALRAFTAALGLRVGTAIAEFGQDTDPKLPEKGEGTT